MNVLRNISDSSLGDCEKQVESPSPLDNLKRQKAHLADKMQRVDAAIEAMEKHPEVTEVLELLAKANY